MSKRLILLMILILFIASCSRSDTSSPENNTDAIEQLTVSPSETTIISPTPEMSTATLTTTPTDTPEPSPTIDLSSVYSEGGYGPVDFPENINPLTGLPVFDPTILDRRPLAIKISNYPRGIRPQWGLSFADIVYEYYHEGGLTRFFALFYGLDLTEVGPIRSARFTDVDLVRMYKAVFAFGSGDYRVRNRLYTDEYLNRLASINDRPCPPSTEYPLCRTDPNGWNHLLTDTQILSQHFTDKGLDNTRQNLDGMYFHLDIPEDGDAGTNITTYYSFGDYHRWEYDSTTGGYVRYQDTVTGDQETFDVMNDRINDQPITTENVVILLAEHSYFLREPEIFEIRLTGFGQAYLFRDGLAYEVNWVRINEGDIISVAYDDGTRFPLKPGNTWFEIVGQTTQITQSDSDWRFDFKIP
ncbi:MAG: DUF3048 domain-containing protein [Anaerolineales bacterium]|jgi:hypothetical protein